MIDNFDAPEGGILKAVTVHVGVDARDEFVKAATVCMETSRKEPGNIHYSLHETRGQDDTFLFLEVWKDQDAADAHGKSDHVATFTPIEKKSQIEPAVARFFEVGKAWVVKVESD